MATTSTPAVRGSVWRHGVARVTARAAIVAVIVSSSVVAGAASPAFAAGEILVSSDGNAWGTSMPQDLFVSTALLVPETSKTETMYVRNGGTSAGYLRISLRDVVVNDATYANALTVSASIPGHPGAPVSVTSAAPCRVLTQGLLVAPGATVPITASIALGDLSGTAGQNESAGMNLSITLSEASTSGMQPTQCLPNDTVVVVTPPGDNGGGTVTPTVDDTGAEPEGEGPSDGEVVIEIPFLPPFTVDANTQDVFEQIFIFGPYAAMILGTGIFFLVARRRNRNDDDDDDDDFDDSDDSDDGYGERVTSPDLVDNSR